MRQKMAHVEMTMERTGKTVVCARYEGASIEKGVPIPT
jgi:hypothetical protein